MDRGVSGGWEHRRVKERHEVATETGGLTDFGEFGSVGDDG